MPFLCSLGFHKWDGCICVRCEIIRDQKHNWDGCRCGSCGKYRDEQHKWAQNCEKCAGCGRTRRGMHNWEGCKCVWCEQTRDEFHDWSHDENHCFVCGKPRVSENADLVKAYASLMNKGRFTEHDNIGKRIYTYSQVQDRGSLLIEKNGELPPHIIYWFTTKEQAMAALLSIPCIKTASDTGTLICTEPLEYGVYETTAEHHPKGPFWTAIIRGPHFFYSTFQSAEESFMKHSGRLLAVKEPDPYYERPAPPGQEKKEENPVQLISEFKHFVKGVITTRKKYRSPSQDIALKFLRETKIEDSSFYIEIDTPEGKFGKNKEGIYIP